MTRPPLLYLPCFDFFDHRQRPHHLLWELSEIGWEVFWCNWPRPGFSGWADLSPRFHVLSSVNQVDRNRTYLMWLTHGPYVEQLGQYRLAAVATDIADSTVEEFAVWAPWNKQRICSGQVVFASSPALVEEARAILSEEGLERPVYLVRNACDYHLFAKTNCAAPDWLQQLRSGYRRIIGFWGAVASWLDWDLIKATALTCPDWAFVFVGAVCVDASALGLPGNVILAGPRDYRELPAIARGFDGAWVPFQIRALTRAVNPVKLYEYLAAGLPVVSTPLPDVTTEAESVVAFASRPDATWLSFERLFRDGERVIRAGRQLVVDSTWQARARFISQVLDGLVS
ncbi:MAG: hypothetical protein AB1331_03570 [Bacillota bacterium]